MGSLVGLRMEFHRIDDTTTTVDLHGELDAYTSPRAKETLRSLLDEGCRHVILNFRCLDFIDSTGLSVLISTVRRAHEYGGSMRIASPSHHMRRIFEITRLTYAFPIDASTEESLASIRQEIEEQRAAA